MRDGFKQTGTPKMLCCKRGGSRVKLSLWRFCERIDLFTDTAAILISIVSNSYYGMPMGQIHINLPPEHPIMSFETIEIKMVAVSVKRSIPGPTDTIWASFESRKLQPMLCVLLVGLGGTTLIRKAMK